jgi:hypothetical protein
MAYTSSLYSMGGVYWDIVAVDRTKEAIDSATQGIDNVGVHYSDTITNIAFELNMIQEAAETVFGYLEKGWEATIGLAINYAEQMKRVSDLTDMSIGDAERWRQTFIDFGANPESIVSVFRILESKLGDQSEAGDKLRSRLNDLKVTIYDSNGKMRDQSDILADLLPALAGMSDATDRANLSQQLFGRNYVQIISLIKNGKAAAEDFKEQNPLVDDEDIEKAHKFGIELGKISEKLQNIGGAAGYDAINMIQGIANATNSAYGVGNPGIPESGQTFGMTKELDIWGNPITKKTPVLTPDVSNPLSKNYLGVNNDSTIDVGGAAGNLDVVKNAIANPYEGLSKTDLAIRTITDVTLPALHTKLVEAQKDGKDYTSILVDIATAEQNLQEIQTADAKEKEKEKVSALVDAYKEYESAIKKVTDLQKEQAENDAEYGYDMGIALQGGNVAQARSITQSYIKARMKANYQMTEVESTAQESTQEFNAIRSGAPLEQVKGTSQYTQAQALASGDLVINFNDVQLSKDYPLTAFVTDAKNLRQVRIAMGGRVQGS